ncbi:MAG: hypothetical protein R3C09_20080 [Pirellulaceae bacterium]
MDRFFADEVACKPIAQWILAMGPQVAQTQVDPTSARFILPTRSS